MGIELAKDQLEVVAPTEEIDEDLFTEEDTTYNFRELYDQVLANEDIIFTVAAEEVTALREGLAIRKSKDNAKLKNADLLIDNRVLKFFVYPKKDDKGAVVQGIMEVRVKLAPKKGVTVLDIRIPSDEI